MVDLNDFKHFDVMSKGQLRHHKKYMGYCLQCGGQRGYIFKAEDGKLCKKCVQPKQTAILIANGAKGVAASAALRLGKSPPNKGIKTGKPAWNAKNTDPVHKLLRNRISRRLRHALSGRGLSKNWQKTFELLGFNAEILKAHLESKFQPGMSWDNAGEWHIDHDVPDSWFTYSSMNDPGFKESWKLENLQPMWKSENISKNNRYSGPYKEGG